MGKTCIMLPTFQSATNGAPFKSFHQQKNYPALLGLLDIDGMYFLSNSNRKNVINFLRGNFAAILKKAFVIVLPALLQKHV